MPHCTKCGTNVGDNVAFCPNCGAPQATNAPVAAAPATVAGSSGLAENVAGTLCYVLGWVTGLIFFIIDKRPFVRFHAAQSIVVFGGLHIVLFILGMVFGVGFMMGGWGFASLGFILFHIIQLAALILWILCMVKAYKGERFRVPVAADLADKIFGKQ